MSDQDILSAARTRYQDGIDGDRDNRDRDIEDRRFYKGEQWDDGDKKARKGRPTLTNNRLPQFVKQITGEMRQNKPAIRVLPIDDKTDPKLAEVYSAIIRHIESQSDAHRVYAKSGEQAVIGGMGWFRILTDYAGDKSFDQEIKIKGVRNPLSVVTDPGAIELTRCDMNWAFVSETMTNEAFREAYPKADLSGWPADDKFYANWRTTETVRVAEYWVRETEARELYLMSDGSTRYGDEDVNPEVMQAMGLEIVRTRTVQAHKVKCYKITANEVLESFDWAGSFIPLIPVIGEEVEIGDEVFRHGLIHHAKDAQRAYNVARSAMVEHASSQPKAPYIATTAMVKNHKRQWESINTGNPPVLLFDPDPMMPGQKPQREQPPTFAAAWYQEAQIADGDMKATTGIYDGSLGKRSNETSGVAIRERDNQADTGSYLYIDNLSAAIRHAGLILLELIPEIYTGERVIRMMGEDGAIEGYERINTMLPGGEVFNDISIGQFDLEVTTGPAFATKRQEASEKMMSLVQSVPAIGQVGADLIVKGLDMPYGDKLADRLGMMLVPPGMDADLDKKRMEMQQAQQQAAGPPQPDPMQEMQVATVKADLENTQADTALKAAKAQREQVLAGRDAQAAALEPFLQGYNADPESRGA